MRPTSPAALTPSRPAGRCRASSSRRRSASGGGEVASLVRLDPLAPEVWDGHRRVSAIIESDERRLRTRDEPAVGALDLVLDVEALRPDPGDSRADLERLAERGAGTEVDVDLCDDHEEIFEGFDAEDLAQVADSGVLDVRQVDGVVDVPEHVEVAKGDFLWPDVAEPLHRPDGTV